jgi:phosphoribosylaminoimidazolecarboxamide formyltransferase/IMP cyclohydrolase
MAEAMPNNKPMFDGVIAPAFQGLSAQALARSKGKCRIMVNPALSREGSALIDRAPRFRYVRGGLLAQPNYSHILDFGDQDIKVYGELTSHQIMKDILLAYCICSTSNSNTITLVKEGMLIGNGVGQQDRVGAAELAVKRAIDAGHGCRKTWRNWFGLKPSYKPLLGAVACSDSFFPFPDGVQVLIDAGVKTIFSTSGSVNDKLIQDLCVENNVTLVQLPDGKARAFFGH